MLYCITLRSRIDAAITGWYTGSGGCWSTDHRRQKVFAKKRDAILICNELRRLCPRNAQVINIEPEQADPALEMVSAEVLVG
jgi:hypothetical protein